MPSMIGLGYVAVEEEVGRYSHKSCDCAEARRGCMPTFVFSVEGQITFRAALAHLVHCRKADCIKLRRSVMAGMREKLQTLFSEDALIGCVHVQPHVYGARSMRLTKNNFSAVCQHLAQCPREGCAKLRRSLMLSIRDMVSPNAQPRQ